jgi:DNA repair protein SbcC/Rad50
MRLHRLTVTAFGPFAGTEHVDFDQLNEAGLFLLTGATGAGKSSLLDAVCFALYGTVPGVRGVKTLKSQHAPATARPEVLLDFTVQGRRFVVRRSPEWTRPKHRGSGVVTEKASASVVERTGGVECLRSARAAEVGLLVSDLMGMNAGQFVQVALLPQGEFQTFLRASSQDRHTVLQQLFGTDRFARIEDWVGEHSRRLKEQAEAGRSGVQRILDTVSDRFASPVPAGLCGDDLAPAAAEGRVETWVSGVLLSAEADAAHAREGARGAAARVREARQHYQEAARRAEQGSRRDSALRVLAELVESEPAASEDRSRLAAHDRASRCTPVLDLRAQALAARGDAASCRDRAVETLVGALPPGAPGLDELLPSSDRSGPVDLTVATGPIDLHDPTEQAVSALLERLRSRAARLEALLPREQAAAEVRRDLDSDLARLAVVERSLEDAVVRAEALPAEADRLGSSLISAAALAARHETLTSALTAARSRQDAAARLDRARHRLAALEDARRDARDRMQDAREDLHTVVAQRLAGMAAELAGALVDGAPCHVCGSVEHPRRATPEVGAVGDRDHQAADQRMVDATSALEAAGEAVRAAQHRHDALASASGGRSAQQAAEEVAHLEADLADAVAAARQCTELKAQLAALRAEQADLGRRQSAGIAQAAALRGSAAAHDRTLTAVTAEISDALGDRPAVASVADAVRRLSSWCGPLSDTRAAVAALDAAQARLGEVTDLAVAAALDQGFGALTDVEEALLTTPTHERLLTRLRERDEAEARARAVLDDPVLRDDPEPADAPEHLRTSTLALAEAESADAEATRLLAVHEDRVAGGRVLLDRLRAALEGWAPTRDESMRAEAISRLVRGMGHDNRLQMRLSAYVLATRLDQVVAAANERLGHMRDQRYLLQRTGRAERRSAQAGLGLEIVDQWTGDTRSPSTLSGGETFVVSLSLALGLADVVTHEAGGTEVETLFVDEGFGTLDADTLDDVMDRLDGLRAGGRTVGIVSHVTELRSRIPTQVQVDKGRAGSTVRVRTLVE